MTELRSEGHVGIKVLLFRPKSDYVYEVLLPYIIDGHGHDVHFMAKVKCFNYTYMPT